MDAAASTTAAAAFSTTAAAAAGRKKERRLHCAVGAMLFVGPSNYVLYKILFAAYGLESALYVMQCVNLLYVIYGHFALTMAERRGEITDAMRQSSRFPFAAMAALDCVGSGQCFDMRRGAVAEGVPRRVREGSFPRRASSGRASRGV